MALSIGIVGVPNVGKSTLFNALTKQSVPAENYPFCTIDPCVGVIEVPDKRLTALATLSNSQKIVPTHISFVDIAGLVRGAAKGEGLGNAFLSHIRETDAIAQVVRCFSDENVLHVEGVADPVRDIEIIETELLLADLAIVEKRIANLEKGVKRGEEEAKKETEVLLSVKKVLTEGKTPTSLGYSGEEKELLKGLGLLSIKPMMYICNVDEYMDTQAVEKVHEVAKLTGTPVITITARSEMELTQFSEEEAAQLRNSESTDGIATVIRKAYTLLNLISFFTTGEKETRAWTIPKGATAKRAGRAIHTDFEKNFIRAEVIATETLLAQGSYAQARTQGEVRIEGKEYIVQDGDVIVFRVG